MSDLNVLTTTAAALATGQGDSMVKSTLRPLLQDQKGVKKLIESTSTNANISKLSSIERDFSLLSADDLHDLPDDPDTSFSLFQGFNATVPQSPTINRGSNLIEYNDGITLNQIKGTQSSKLLRSYQTQLNYSMDLLSIKRGTALDEVKVIDANIDKLYLLRSQLSESIKTSEVETNKLNELLLEIEERLQLIGVIDEDISCIEDHHHIDDHQFLGSSSLSSTNMNTNTNFHEQQQFEWQAHDSPITCLASNSNTLVTASLDNSVRVWDISTMTSGTPKCTGLIEGHLSLVQCMEFDNTTLATGSSDASVKLWDLTTMTPNLLHSFESHIDEISALSFKSGDLVSASQDKTIRQWDTQTGKLIQTIDVLWANSIMMNSTHLDLSPILDSNYTTVQGKPLPFITTLQCLSPALASGTSDGLIRLWDLRTGDVIRQFQGHQSPILDLELDQSGKLVSSDTAGCVRVWDLRSGATDTIWRFDNPVIGLGFHNDDVVNVNAGGVYFNDDLHMGFNNQQDPSQSESQGQRGVVCATNVLKRRVLTGSYNGYVGVYKI